MADVVDRREIGRQQVVLGGVSDPGPNLRAEVERVETEHLDPTGVGPVEPEQ